VLLGLQQWIPKYHTSGYILCSAARLGFWAFVPLAQHISRRPTVNITTQYIHMRYLISYYKVDGFGENYHKPHIACVYSKNSSRSYDMVCEL